MTAESSSAGMNDMRRRERGRGPGWRARGNVSSLRMFLTPSAAGCSRPAQPDPVGAAPILHPGADLPLHQRQERHAHHDDGEDDQHLDDAEQEEALHLGRHRAAPAGTRPASTRPVKPRSA